MCNLFIHVENEYKLKRLQLGPESVLRALRVLLIRCQMPPGGRAAARAGEQSCRVCEGSSQSRLQNQEMAGPGPGPEGQTDGWAWSQVGDRVKLTLLQQLGNPLPAGP